MSQRSTPPSGPAVLGVNQATSGAPGANRVAAAARTAGHNRHPERHPKASSPMRTMTARLTAILGGAALATGLLAGFAGAASAAPGDLPPSTDRVIGTPPLNSNRLMVATSATVGARIVSVPRIGKAAETPDSQVWTFDNSRKFDDAGNVIRGGRSFIFQPTFDRPGVRPLCVDVVGNSTAAGAAFELRPCDGTPSQVFVQVGDVRFPNLKNAFSGLYMQVEQNGAIVQQPFAKEDFKASIAERNATKALNDAKIFAPRPKVFGIGGA